MKMSFPEDKIFPAILYDQVAIVSARMYAYIGETLPLLEFRKSLWLQGILRFQLEPLAQEKGACCRSSRGL